MRATAFVLFFLSFYTTAFSQEEITFSGKLENLPLSELLEKIENENPGKKFYYLENWINDIKVTGEFNNAPLKKVMDEVLFGTGLRFFNHNNNVLAIVKTSAISTLNAVDVPEETDKTKKVFGDPSFKPQGKVNLTGYLKDGANGDAIIGGTIYVEELKTGVSTNVEGFYSLPLDPGEYHVRFAYVGYQEDYVTLSIYENAKLDMELFSEVTKLEEVVISGEASDANVSNIQFGAERLSIDRIKSMPAFLGEVDVVKSILMLPGVSTTGEGASGFNVRGGNVDQNLVLLDGGLIFNPSHIFGFFSAFNSEVVKDAILFKGNIPAQYGGRASSVLDVKLIEGNRKKITGRAGVGPITAKLALEGPIKKDKSSFVLAGRASFSDWILKRLPSVQLRNSSASFSDANFKLSQDIGEKSKLSLSLYGSQDEFAFDRDTLYNWSTTNATLRWSHLFSDKIFSTAVLAKGRYNYNVEDITGENQYKLTSTIDYERASWQLKITPNFQHSIDFGLDATRFLFSPGNFVPANDSFLEPITLDKEKGLELAAYISDEFKIDHRFSVLIGLRYSTFFNIGPGSINTYDESGSRSEATIVGEQQFSNGEVIQRYDGIEPRVSFKSMLGPTSSLKLSYGITNQYLHLISNTAAVTPVDIWKMSDPFLKPLRASQYSLGYFRNFKDNAYESSVEVYYKKLDNIVEYIDHAELLLNNHIETEVVNAEGNTYGVEVSIKKNKGRLNGWASYTYSRSLRKVQANTARETVNNGETFPSNFDKPHDLTIVGNYRLSRKYSLSFNFTYNTGRPITAPLYRYRVGNLISVDEYSNRNELRIPDYHRLDLSLTIKTNQRKTSKFESDWVVSVYNVYGRKNAYSVFFQQQVPEGPKRLSVIGTVFPSITYNLKF
ncbi:TonB-dependent receptor [Fulvivirgaceae bacterium BMA10]|uniref:TonB-dependent receptor n=1 Tax=Splendidivirga corallicola TaxID=3051826 RepID=A0ABT8KUU9_9BACT|nr:TonB-dependent receptor [Fulvivirgaceae bacterium BMA10]